MLNVNIRKNILDFFGVLKGTNWSSTKQVRIKIKEELRTSINQRLS